MACDVEVFLRPKSPTGGYHMAVRAQESNAQSCVQAPTRKILQQLRYELNS